MKPALALEENKDSLALSENKILRYTTFILLYFAQGIFEGFAFFAVPLWMAANGKTAGEIAGFIAVLMIPWTFKFLIGPILDKYTYLSMGRKRPWIIFGQVGICLTFVSLSFLNNPLDSMGTLIILTFVLSLFTAVQDVATDGLAVEITPTNQQGRMNALMWGSKIVSIAVWLAAGTWLINNLGFQDAVLVPAAAILVVLIGVFIVREHPGEKQLPWSEGRASEEAVLVQHESWRSLFRTLFKMILTRSNLLLLLVLLLFQLSFACVDTLNKIFIVQEVLWTDSAASNWIATCILISGVGGLLFGGFLLKKYGSLKIVKWGLITLILLAGSMAVLKPYWQSPGLIESFTLIFSFAYTISTISMLALAMTCCVKSIAATQFTVYMAFANLGIMSGAKLLAVLKGFLDWQIIFLVICILALVVIFFIRRLELSPPEGNSQP